MTINKQKLVQEFIKTVKVPYKNPRKQMIIAPIGVVASGKTTTMKILKELLPVIYLNTDEARVFLRKKKLWNKIAAWELMNPAVEHFLKLNKSLIVDGDFVDWRTRRQPLEKLAKKFKTAVYYINITAPEDFIIRKLINKKWSKSGLFKDSAVGVREYFRRKPLHQKKLNIKFTGTVDTSKPIKPQILKIIPKIK